MLAPTFFKDQKRTYHATVMANLSFDVPDLHRTLFRPGRQASVRDLREAINGAACAGNLKSEVEACPSLASAKRQRSRSGGQWNSEPVHDLMRAIYACACYSFIFE